ncbi:MAG: phage antirepressor KilAC domain-containing protein [Azoarcus sp.]|jgi:phage antirepressor YoqD-like protein|nr:phage antirepressor KilAC domain-containing protein [Azoarcus sp.]
MSGFELISAEGKVPLTMSSLEISRLVESTHADVRSSIERLVNRGVITLQPLAEVLNDGPGPKTISVYRLCKRDSFVVVAQLSPEFTAALVDRGQELEGNMQNPVAALSDPAFPRATIFGYTVKVLALEAKVSEQAPKVAALARIEAGKKSLTITQTAKVLEVKRDELTRRLHAEGWIYRQNNSWGAHSSAIHIGRMEYKEAHYSDDDGHEVAKPYCHLTPKGIVRLASLLGADRGDFFKGVA